MKTNEAFGHPLTAAVGDGANDVNMILTANVGFGIRGNEGSQAANFADYGINRFYDLHRLVFWHGRSFSQKSLNYMMWFTFKSMVFSVEILFYNLMNGFSADTNVDD